LPAGGSSRVAAGTIEAFSICCASIERLVTRLYSLSKGLPRSPATIACSGFAAEDEPKRLPVSPPIATAPPAPTWY